MSYCNHQVLGSAYLRNQAKAKAEQAEKDFMRLQGQLREAFERESLRRLMAEGKEFPWGYIPEVKGSAVFVTTPDGRKLAPITLCGPAA